jgi:hypothetical protein
MAMLQATPTTRGSDVDVRRLGLATLDGRSRRHPGLRVPLPVAALLAEADRVLRPARVRLLVLDADGARVDVTLADRSGEAVWMGALPTRVDVGGVATCLPTGRDDDAHGRRRTLADAMSAVGFARGTDSWFAWEAPRTF